MQNNIPRHLAIFPISFVEEITNLTARQIRYYEEQDLIHPVRNKGKQRIFSLNDLERLLEIKSLIDQRVNIAGIKAILSSREQEQNAVAKDEFAQAFSKKELEDIVHGGSIALNSACSKRRT
ncbi:MerR family transcriptional regulator, glutamine synthetase repressor [Evansella caseinilytica]|uniref:MerR family transcriptional regulator, glutamine synthetase repressor n=1 Tax=Evansella caseinilytica TaxID=1503961 RepID=A0A1H3NX28_9BACI|nr:MerR family transcriptional regulator [Evansella caseinilytica]SDY93075.1 MerR family transcriptional regulator, glutamine synthetase repressor [Evansella caseinilytica]